MQETIPLTRTLKIEDLGDSYQAPATTCVRRKDGVLFANGTKGDVSIQFGKDSIFGRKGLKLKSQEEKELTVQPAAPEGFHGVAIFCHERGQFAEGGSMPIIIVDPKT